MPLATDTIDDLCHRLVVSDVRAFEHVFHHMRGHLLRYVRSVVGGEATAHDLVQDVFVSLWGLRETLDPTKSLQAYLYRMARNRAYRHLRDTRTHAEKHQQILQEATQAMRLADRADGAVDQEQLAGHLQAWIADLPERQREALLLSRMHQLSHREIAAIMEVSPRTVNNHIIRALDHLRERLAAYEQV